MIKIINFLNSSESLKYRIHIMHFMITFYNISKVQKIKSFIIYLENYRIQLSPQKIVNSVRHFKDFALLLRWCNCIILLFIWVQAYRVNERGKNSALNFFSWEHIYRCFVFNDIWIVVALIFEIRTRVMKDRNFVLLSHLLKDGGLFTFAIVAKRKNVLFITFCERGLLRYGHLAIYSVLF